MVHSFLLIGQSNMAGRGFIREAREINGEGIRIQRNGRWQPFFRPVQPDRSFSGVSLAESFAEKYAGEHNALAGLIPCADGGTRIDQWVPGGLLYQNAVHCARMAQQTSVIAGVLWHQGESDCTEELAAGYEKKLSYLMESFRRDLGLYDVPFLLGGLGEYLVNFKEGTISDFFPKINEILEDYSEKTPMTGFVSAKGLACNPDNLHFSSQGLYDFGIRYYDVFKTLEDKHKVFEEKPFDITDRGALETL